jgi:hypothetical protein
MEKTGDSKTLSRKVVPPDPAVFTSKNKRWQPGSVGFPQVIAFPWGFTLTKRGDPLALRKSRDTGTIGASNAVVPPAAGGFPRVLKNQMSFGAPLGPKPAVEYCPLKLGTESMPGIPGSVACCVPVICGMPALPKGERLG